MPVVVVAITPNPCHNDSARKGTPGLASLNMTVCGAICDTVRVVEAREIKNALYQGAGPSPANAHPGTSRHMGFSASRRDIGRQTRSPSLRIPVCTCACACTRVYACVRMCVCGGGGGGVRMGDSCTAIAGPPRYWLAIGMKANSHTIKDPSGDKRDKVVLRVAAHHIGLQCGLRPCITCRSVVICNVAWRARASTTVVMCGGETAWQTGSGAQPTKVGPPPPPT